MAENLYETIGGRSTIEAAIENFYRKVLEDPDLRPFFSSTDMAHLRAGQSMFLSMLLGGRYVYSGRDIGSAHAQARAQGLTEEHFNTFLRYFREALDEVGVEPEKADKVMNQLRAKRLLVLNR